MRTNRSSTILWLLTMSLLLTVTVSTASGADVKRFDGVTLRVATYGGPWKDGLQSLIAADMEQHGAKVEFVTGPPSAHLAKLIAARGKAPPFDLTEVDEPSAPLFMRAGVLQKYDVAKLSHSAGLVSPIAKDGYLVPDWVFEDGVVYNADKFRELGLAPPTRYRDLLDPKLKGRVGVPDISNNLGLFVVLGFALDSGGSETNVAPGIEAMKGLGATQFFTGNPAAQTALANGDIWANFMGASWAVRLRRAGHDWAKFAALKVGDKTGIWERGYMGLVKGTPNAEAAHYFVDRYISPEVQRELALRLGSVAVNKDALRELDKDPLLHEVLMLAPAQIANMRMVDFDNIDILKWREEWNRIMLH
ncbi:MAG TPA: extracellular solute-binding protein [Casimicrobiaceae bacterium]|nr:extracellular solute-binding protein [Casimicrobiaceae bacterium]